VSAVERSLGEFAVGEKGHGVKCRGSSPELPFEVGRGGHVANSNLGNGNLRPETFGRTRQELPLRIADRLLRPILGEASYGNVVLSCGVGNHVDLRGLPGGAQGIRTSDPRGATCASPPAAGSCSAASSTPFPRGSLAGGCGSASTRIGSSLSSPQNHLLIPLRGRPEPGRGGRSRQAVDYRMPGALIGLAYRDAATRPS
jgi:hypothetical protein